MTGFARLLEPPRLRTRGRDVDEQRRATWLELFFDLVFVAAVSQLANALSAEPTTARFFEFLGLFVPVWWAWMGFTFYANRFDTDDLVYRLLMLCAMFGVAVLATTIPSVFEGATRGFPIAYVAVRIVLVTLYARTIRHVAEARALATSFVGAFSFSLLIWLASLAVDRPWAYLLWGVALAIELAAPIPAWRLLRDAPVDRRHLPERFGLLTLIVLGESVLAVVLGVSKVSWDSGSAVAAAMGFMVAAALWWIYFDFLDEGALTARGIFGGLTYTYMNYFVVAGLTALGVGVKLAIFASGGDHHYDGTSWVLSAGLALTMAGLGVIQLVAGTVVIDTDVVLRLLTAAIALVLIPFGLSPLAVVAIFAFVLAAQVVYELARHETHTHTEEI
ncbi:MAG: low temperature requirement protein A [Actinobacteria bacterium]|nr:MAG: low temperature requirement protein A [Actinomycetota bacterium]